MLKVGLPWRKGIFDYYQYRCVPLSFGTAGVVVWHLASCDKLRDGRARVSAQPMPNVRYPEHCYEFKDSFSSVKAAKKKIDSILRKEGWYLL